MKERKTRKEGRKAEKNRGGGGEGLSHKNMTPDPYQL
jgi:hypothetical protein